MEWIFSYISKLVYLKLNPNRLLHYCGQVNHEYLRNVFWNILMHRIFSIDLRHRIARKEDLDMLFLSEWSAKREETWPSSVQLDFCCLLRPPGIFWNPKFQTVLWIRNALKRSKNNTFFEMNRVGVYHKPNASFKRLSFMWLKARKPSCGFDAHRGSSNDPAFMYFLKLVMLTHLCENIQIQR